MAAPMSDEELYQLTGSWEAAAALRDEQRQAPAAEAPKFTPLSATPTLAELKAMYNQMGATQARENVTEQGTTIDYIPVQYGGGWMAGEKDNRKIIDYIGQGMDATPVYDDAPKTLGGFSRQEGDYIYNYSPEGDYLGRTKWNESDLKRIIKDLGPLAMAAVTMGGGGAFLGNSLFGLTGSAASAAGGALAGGINAYGNDQDILKGALLGGVSGAGTAKLTDILGADALGGTFKNATLGDVTKAINFAKDPTLAGAANLASPYIDTNIKLGDTGFTTNDVLKGLNTVQALGSGNDKKVFDAITGLAKTYGGSTSGGTGSNAGSTITDLTEEDIAELNPGELQAYRDKGVQGISDFRRDMKLLGSLSKSGYAGDDLGGNVTENLTNTTSNTGATISTSQDILDYLDTLGTDTIKDSGLSNQDILNMVGLGADDTVTVTDKNNYDATNDFLTLNNPAGNISKNYTDDLNELVITGNKNGTSLNDFITLNDIVGNTTSDDTVVVTGKTDKTDTTDTKKDDDIEELVVVDDKIKGCAPGFHDDGTGFCIPDDDDDDDTKCAPGFHDDGTGLCVPDDDVKEDGCPEGYVLDLATNQCVKVGDTKVTVPPKKVVTPKVDTKKKTTDDMMDSLGLRREAPSQDPYANIKSMEDLFGGDIAYKLRALGVNPSQKTASSDMDELVRLLRG
jgi:hypothetical protein